MFETSAIELSATALRNNLNFIRKRMNKDVRLCSVVKGNAYGHGLCEYVSMAMNAGVNYFAVHSADEAFHLKKSLVVMPDLFIMGVVENEAVEWAVQQQIEFSVFDWKRIESSLYFSKKHKTKAKIHIEMETGMRRTGFEKEQISELCNWLKRNSEYITFQGLFTHYAGAENQANHFRISKQIESFNQSLQQFEIEKVKPVYHHSACSAALLNYPETQGNMVRIGILQYGFWPNKETHTRFCSEKENNPDLLKRVIRWTTNVLAVKEVSKGSFVGYGTAYLAHYNMTVAVIPIGYSHGFTRNLSNVGSVLIKGKPAQVVGLVNMNSITVDITNIDNVKPGDEVVLIGKQNGKVITVNSFSEQSHLLNYELLTRLPYDIPRIVTN